MDIPPPDPKKLLAAWMEWERGESSPGRVMADLKTAGLRKVLDDLAAAAEAATAAEAVTPASATPAGAAGSAPPP